MGLTVSMLAVFCCAVVTFSISAPEEATEEEKRVLLAVTGDDIVPAATHETLEMRNDTQVSMMPLAQVANVAGETARLAVQQEIERTYVQELKLETAASMPRATELWAPDAPHLMLTDAQVETAWIVWDFLIEAGFSEEITAGFLGNIYRESALDPRSFSDAGCFGLIQWAGGRLSELYTLPNYDTAEVQLEFVLIELAGSESEANARIMEASTVSEAAVIIARHYERCAWSESEKQTRIAYAQAFYDQMRQ